MSNVGFATLTIIPSAKGFGAALSGDVNPQMGKAGKTGGAALGAGVVGSLAKFAGPIAGALAVGAIADFAKGTVAAASELQQSAGAVSAVFKDQAGQVREWASQSASSVGLATNEYNEFASVLGSQLKNGGTALDELAPKTDNLIRLGADLSSMFGGTTAEAVESLSSALRGERDPIEKYGVSLTQAAVDAKAAELGFTKVGGTLSSQANQAATLALIMDQTADAQGNFARESDTLAQAQQVLAARFENGKAAIGEAFLPAVTAVTSALSAGLGPAMEGTAAGATALISGVSGFFASFGGGASEIGGTASTLSTFGAAARAAVQPLVDVWPEVTAAVAPLASVIGSTLSGILPQLAGLAPSLSPLGLVFQALAPVLPELATLVGTLANVLANNLATTLTTLGPILQQVAQSLMALFSGVFVALMPVVTTLVQTLGSVLGQLGPVLTSLSAAFLPLISALIGALLPAIMMIVQTALPPLIAAFQQIIAVVLPIVNQLLAAVVPVFQAIIAAIMPLIQVVLSILIPVIQALLPVVTTVFGVVADVITSAMQIVQGIIQVVLGVISGNWGQVWDGIKNIVSGVWNTIKSLISGALAIVQSVIGAALSVIRSLFSSGWNALRGVVSTAWSGITSAISSGVSSAVSFVSQLPGRIMSALSGLGSMLVSVGSNMMQGLIRGVQAVAGRIKDAVLGPIKNSVEAVKSFLGIHSPSRLFREIGGFTGEGMALGLRDSAGLVARAAHSALVPDVDPSVEAPTVRGGGLAGAMSSAGVGGGPFIGQVTLASTGDVKSDLDELDFYVRRKTRGGRFG